MNAGSTGRRLIAVALAIILIGWIVFALPPRFVVRTDFGKHLGMGYGITIILGFVATHTVGFSLGLVGAMCLAYDMVDAKSARTPQNWLVLILGSSLCSVAGWYVWHIWYRFQTH